jgi:cytochrome c-type biogenesis protein
MGLDQTMLGALAAGVLSFLSPCILPLVPPYLCFLTGSDLSRLSATDSEAPLSRLALSRSAFFVAGFATVFVILGATASSLGQWMAQWFDLLAIVAGILILGMGLHFLGVFRIGLLFREARFQALQRPAGPLGAYLVGLAFAFGWTPCVGPVLAAILLIAGTQDAAAHGVALLTAYSVGIGLPFIAAAAFVGPFLRFLRQFRTYVPIVEKIMGVALVVTGLIFITGTMPLIGNWLLETFPVFGAIG